MSIVNTYTINFVAFHVDMAKNYPKRQYLAGMLLPDDPDGGRLVNVGPDYVGYCYLSTLSAIL
jgi:hypothetical protein